MSEEHREEHREEENVLQQENTAEAISETEILKEQLQREKDQFLRLFAEFDNFKKRTSKERLDIFKTANAETITSLLPVLDDFERAIKEIGKSNEQQHLKGVELIQTKLLETLRSKGLNAIEINIGDDFNTDQMEAVTQVPAPSDELKGKVIDIVETGYALTDKIIRYAKVVVGQ